MYRDSDAGPQKPDPEPELHAIPAGRRFAPTPLGIVTGVLALAADFFAIFLLAWGVSPTSDGCGVSRSVTMLVAAAALSIAIIGVFAAVGLGLMREAREPQRRRRSYLATAAGIYAVGVIPLLAFAGLVGSCFDF
jgi:MFS family permease